MFPAGFFFVKKGLKFHENDLQACNLRARNGSYPNHKLAANDANDTNLKNKLLVEVLLLFW